MQIHIVYHNADLDGHCSGAILKYAFPNAILYGMDYGDPFPIADLAPDDVVFMVDFSLQPFEKMIALDRRCDLIWIDHHKTAIDEYHKGEPEEGPPLRGTAFLRTELAACELTWNFLSQFTRFYGHDLSWFSGSQIPEAVTLLGRYDLWKHTECPGSLEFQYGMRMQQTDPVHPAAMRLWKALFGQHKRTEEVHLLDIKDAGRVALAYQKQQNASYVRHAAFPVIIDGLRCIACNRAGGSLLFESVYDPTVHDAMLTFVWSGKHWKVSLFSDKPDIDVSAVCKARGGGGHRGAAGFETVDIEIRPPQEGEEGGYSKMLFW